MSKLQSQLPGNFGGETLREYCGLSRKRNVFYMGKSIVRYSYPAISTQDLYRAIRRHQQEGGAK